MRQSEHLTLLKALGFSIMSAALVLALGCGEDDTSAGCTRDDDCRGSRVCQEGACIEDSAGTSNLTSNTTPPASSNATSNTTTDPACAGDMECPVGQVCDQGVCGIRACSGDADCASSDRFCLDGVCIPNIPCDNDMDCAAIDGVCVEGSCGPGASGCIVDGDCPDPMRQACVDAVCTNRCIGSGMNQCESGQICLDNVCVEPECRGEGTSEDCGVNQICQAGQCVDFTPCDDDSACAPGDLCNDEGICTPRTACIGDQQCESDQQCVDGLCYDAQLCGTRTDCDDGLDCVGGICVPFVCRGPDDCEGAQICEGGECRDPDPTAIVNQVVILTPPQLIVDGQSITFSAVALDGNNAIIPGTMFTWSASNSPVADINETDGVAIGGAEGGVSEITATAIGSTQITVTSDPVSLRNPGPAAADTARVTVVDASTGAPVVGATITRGDASLTTDASGQASFTRSDSPQTISAFANGYNHISLIAISSNDVVLPMSVQSGQASIAGFTGSLDMSQVSAGGDITLGLAGASLNGQLSEVNLASILGDPFSASIDTPIFQTELPLPGGLVLYGTVLGFPLSVKEDYFAQSNAGLKVGWAFGGRIDTNTLLPLVMGGGADLSNLLPILLPLFENFDHGIKSVSLEERPLIIDGDDIDGDGNTTELIPDFPNFPTHNLTPSFEQTLRTALTVQQLPDLPGDGDPLGIVLGGIIADGIGFVPMGINVIQDEDGDGMTDPVTLRTAPAHTGLSVGRYAIVVLSFDSSGFDADLQNGLKLPEDLSVVFWQGDSIPNNLSIPQNFMGASPSSFDPPSRTFSAQPTAGASFYRVRFVGDTGSWDVWVSNDALDFELPTTPESFDDWAAGASLTFEAFSTRDGLQLDTLVEANDTRLNGLNDVMTSFSRTAVSE